MFKIPSSRRKSKQEGIVINLVPILDAMVTLIAFLLFTSSFIAIVVINTPAPLLAPADEQIEELKTKPLQLTAYIKPDHIMISDWSGSRENHVIKNVDDPSTGETRYDLEKLHQTLVEIKLRHPKETKLVLKPDGGVAYEVIVGIIDAARFFENTDTPLFRKNENGIDEPERNLFPEVIFGNIMS